MGFRGKTSDFWLKYLYSDQFSRDLGCFELIFMILVMFWAIYLVK